MKPYDEMSEFDKIVSNAIISNTEGSNKVSTEKLLALIDKTKWQIEGLNTDSTTLNDILPHAIYGLLLDAILIDYVPEESNEDIYQSENFKKLTENYDEGLYEELEKLDEEDIKKYIEKMLSNEYTSSFIRADIELLIGKIGFEEFTKVLLKNDKISILENHIKILQTQIDMLIA